MRLLIVGTGTIGKPLIRLFLKERGALAIEEVIFHKNAPEEKCRGMLEYFHSLGAKLAVYPERMDEFKKLLAPRGFHPDYTFVEAAEKADVVIDCTDKGIAQKLKEKYYQNWSHQLGFIAQGSEKGFGKPYAFDVNDRALEYSQDRFIQVVSCNTHQVLCLLKTLVFDPDNSGAWQGENLVKARFYLARRGADVSQDETTLGPNAGRPTDPLYGSHQGTDAIRVLRTFDEHGYDIHTVADTFPNPYMHVVNFDVTVREKVTVKEVENRFRFNPLTAVTYETRSNRIFAVGRDQGHFGRILNQTVVCLPSLEVVSDGHEIIGRCFTPQDGNALLSSVAAVLWLKYPDTYKKIVRDHFFKMPFLFNKIEV